MDDNEAANRAAKLIWNLIPQEIRERELREMTDEDAGEMLKLLAA